MSVIWNFFGEMDSIAGTTWGQSCLCRHHTCDPAWFSRPTSPALDTFLARVVRGNIRRAVSTSHDLDRCSHFLRNIHANILRQLNPRYATVPKWPTNWSQIVLNYLRTPTLEEIAMDMTPFHGPNAFHPLKSLIDRSACPLQKLCLRGCLPVFPTTEILRAYPSITTLAIVVHASSGGAASTLISQLVVGGPSTQHETIVPQLTEILVGCEDEASIDHAAYLRMLRSRCGHAECTLKAAALLTHLGSRPDPTTLSGLNALYQAGLNLLLLEGVGAGDVIDSWIYVTQPESCTTDRKGTVTTGRNCKPSPLQPPHLRALPCSIGVHSVEPANEQPLGKSTTLIAATVSATVCSPQRISICSGCS
ncbi:hypothetical protein DFH07DRAFT_767143 [Mycena maculata]|uniref:Uncharacterized protein n=1 Tax=Mycena maculata TaxID=230809 RepID=A0AAD7K2T6_9AGAR|nr:hypothetical protein DFH07DRAFT_767143 [Mycena maculata]